jgi:hypothetical protein
VEAEGDLRPVKPSRAVEALCETRGKIGNPSAAYYTDNIYFDSFQFVLKVFPFEVGGPSSGLVTDL